MKPPSVVTRTWFSEMPSKPGWVTSSHSVPSAEIQTRPLWSGGSPRLGSGPTYWVPTATTTSSDCAKSITSEKPPGSLNDPVSSHAAGPGSVALGWTDGATLADSLADGDGEADGVCD